MREFLCENYPVVEGEGEEDGFHLEAIASGRSVYQMQVADACLVVKVAIVDEGRRGEARLLAEEVVTNIGKVPSYITRLAFHSWRGGRRDGGVVVLGVTEGVF